MRIHFHQTFEEDQAASELKDLLGRINARKRVLVERWRKAHAYDRMLAVRRLLDEASLEPQMKIDLWEKHQAVQAAWARIRSVQVRLAAAARLPEPPRDLPLWKHAVTMGQVELQRAEGERDRVLGAHALWDDLFTTSETFLLAKPYTRETVPLRELLSVQGALEDRVKDFERMADSEKRQEAVERTKAALRILAPVQNDNEALAAE
jgi:hypothetical protein